MPEDVVKDCSAALPATRILITGIKSFPIRSAVLQVARSQTQACLHIILRYTSEQAKYFANLFQASGSTVCENTCFQ
jgi:hypothetical protein